MVLLTPTPRLLAAIDVYKTLPSVTPVASPTASLPHQDIYAISRALLSHDSTNPNYTFAALLRGTSVYTPPPPPAAPKSPEYTALMARLRKQQEEAEYRALTSSAPVEEEEDEMTWKEVKSQISVIFNVLLSVFATAAAVWKVASGWDVPQRLAAAFVSALVVAVAEVVLFAGYMRRLEDARKRERREKEKKGIVGVWEVGKGGVKKRMAGREKAG
ncbi:endoplasmic reticulum-based factor for assembly of V-ATPase-domain-containing protein [Trichophaea hybrida]|nr:endoplasmic reticulum-based factor for assembly of V-ATPase-domain-containing protein [Trichophaea hybrida]